VPRWGVPNFAGKLDRLLRRIRASRIWGRFLSDAPKLGHYVDCARYGRVEVLASRRLTTLGLKRSQTTCLWNKISYTYHISQPLVALCYSQITPPVKTWPWVWLGVGPAPTGTVKPGLLKHRRSRFERSNMFRPTVFLWGNQFAGIPHAMEQKK